MFLRPTKDNPKISFTLTDGRPFYKQMITGLIGFIPFTFLMTVSAFSGIMLFVFTMITYNKIVAFGVYPFIVAGIKAIGIGIFFIVSFYCAIVAYEWAKE